MSGLVCSSAPDGKCPTLEGRVGAVESAAGIASRRLICAGPYAGGVKDRGIEYQPARFTQRIPKIGGICSDADNYPPGKCTGRSSSVAVTFMLISQ